MVKADGMGTAKTSVFKMLGSNKLAPLMKVACNFQDIGLKKTAGGATARINLGKMGIPSDRLLPSLAHQSFAEVISKNLHWLNRKLKLLSLPVAWSLCNTTAGFGRV